LATPPGLTSCSAVLAYEGAGRELVARLKYRNARAALGRLAIAMAALVHGLDVDVVTWAPTSSRRRRARGFDQGELLARAVAKRLRRPCRRLLDRGPGPAQTGRARAERLRGPQFVARAGVPHRVLVIDDVITTGATVTAAARALATAGAREVHAVAVARTPRPRPPPQHARDCPDRALWALA
jgi:predicted amidophosphoribosyltransferase